MGISSSIVRSSNGHDGDDDENVPRRYSANKLNNISEGGLTLSSNRFPSQSKFHQDEGDEIVSEKDAVGNGRGNGSGSSATMTMNPLHTQNMV